MDETENRLNYQREQIADLVSDVKYLKRRVESLHIYCDRLERDIYEFREEKQDKE